ncbi:SprT family protein [Oceanobacillus kapialis]|uniref:SprT family protein n=1 Tax=Oceanobacillus kapialis TaxID=481353 RepID=UPI00384C8ED1
MKMMNEKELYNIVEELSKKYFKRKFLHSVCFNNRLRTTGGRYLPAKRVIEINPKYLEAGMEEFKGIIKHELCHYFLHIDGKGYKHGDQDFKNLLKETNSPRFCNPLPSQKVVRQYQYVCKTCGHVYERRRRVNVKKYRCGKCRGSLQLQKEK